MAKFCFPQGFGNYKRKMSIKEDKDWKVVKEVKALLFLTRNALDKNVYKKKSNSHQFVILFRKLNTIKQLI